jgi:CRP-like cAMP-binding protein
MELVELQNGDILIEANTKITHMYFPIDCVTSTVQQMSDGSTVEVGLMGMEGFVGVQFWLHMQETPTRTLVQVEGNGFKMRASDFEREIMKTDSSFNDLCARYTHSFLVMTSQAAACNRLHTVDERLCRWLKMVHDRVRRNTFSMRHEFMAQMLGVHRPAVSIAANMLQKAGLIQYSRGRMEILDPEGLEQGACECYKIIDKELDRIFGQSWRALAREDTAN